MGVFEDITLGWNGKTYIIPSDRVMGAVNRIEEHVPLKELHDQMADRGTVKLGKLAAAYSSVLQYAGAKVSVDEVYGGLFGEGATEAVMGAVEGLMSMLIPPTALTSGQAKVKSPGKPPRQARRVAASLSRKRSKLRGAGD